MLRYSPECVEEEFSEVHLQEPGSGHVISRPVVVDRNMCHFLWYGGIAGEGLRSVGAASPSKSVCSILPLARHLRAGVQCGVPAFIMPLAAPWCSPSSLAQPSLWQRTQITENCSSLLRPGPMPQGVSYVHQDHDSAMCT